MTRFSLSSVLVATTLGVGFANAQEAVRIDGRDAAVVRPHTPGGQEQWLAAEQPELAQELERAPVLQTESLGAPARGVNVWERWMVPNMDGQSWDVLEVYFKEYRGPTWLYAMDLGTGQVNRQRLPDDFQFYLSGRALGPDGKYYIATPWYRTWSMHMFVYDPATNTLEERGEIVPGLGGEVRPLAVGPDGRIYGTGTRGNQVGLYIYDPNLRKVVKDFGPVGPSHPNGAWSRYVMGVDDTHAYIASGMIPAWYLVAVNLQTGEEKVLLESPTECVMDIVEDFPGAWAIVPQSGGATRKEYWLYHGEAIEKVNDTPPWPRQASPWDKAVEKPQTYFDQIDPDADGNATFWYRLPEDARAEEESDGNDEAHKSPEERGWKSIRLTDVETYPHRINPLSLMPDGRLYGTGDDYVGSFLFDPATDKTTYLGPRTGLAPYTTVLCAGKLYFSGYAGGPLVVYDPQRPWTMGQGGPPGQRAPALEEPASNPRRLGSFTATRVAIMHSSAQGADGKIYFGGFGERGYTGGGLGWYDPQTGELDGFWQPLSGYTVHYISAALSGRAIVISTTVSADELNSNQAPAESKLFVYDVAEKQIVREIVPVARGRTTGLIAEVADGRVLGLTSDREHADRCIMYGVDVTTGAVLFRKPLPSPVSTDAYWPHWVDPSYEYESLTRGPDGCFWTYLKDVLVRIDPQDARVHVVGKIVPVGYPTFVGRDMYLSGDEQLRRIRNVVPDSCGNDGRQDALKVAKVRRISHPGFGAGQCTFGIRDPWNYDRSRLMYNEGADFTGQQPDYYWSPVVWGFVSELKLIVTLGDNNGDVIPEQGGWEIDVKTTQRTYVPVARDDYSRWPAIGSHGHGTFSPDRSKYFRCGVNELRALPSQELIRTFATWQRYPPFSLEHLSWRASNDWFTSETGGPEWNRIAAQTGQWPTKPLLDEITVYQIWTDGEIKPLLTTTTACAWSGNDGAQHWNYEGEPIPDHSRDGRQLIFPSYDGVYSADDHASCDSAPWGYCGLFLADLVPAAGNDDKLAPSKPTMLSGVFDPSSRLIRLAWTRCADNVGVDGYSIYRDGEKIATTGFVDYADTLKDPLSASYRYRVGAVDVAGNEAQSDEITVRAPR